MKKLDREFYNRESLFVAKELLCKVLVHRNGRAKNFEVAQSVLSRGKLTLSPTSYQKDW